MTSRTERIISIVQTDFQSETSPHAPQERPTERLKEMTSVAIHFCTIVECYKINEMNGYCITVIGLIAIKRAQVVHTASDLDFPCPRSYATKATETSRQQASESRFEELEQ